MLPKSSAPMSATKRGGGGTPPVDSTPRVPGLPSRPRRIKTTVGTGGRPPTQEIVPTEGQAGRAVAGSSWLSWAPIALEALA